MLKKKKKEYFIRQGFHSDLMERSKVLQTAKAKSIQHHQASFARNVKGNSLSKKEKATTRNMKIMKGKTSPIKEINYTVKVVNQPCTKLVGRLKEKSSKIIYICNKQLRDIQNKNVKCDVKKTVTVGGGE